MRIILLALLCGSMLLGGCSSSYEVRERAFVQGAGIEIDDDGWSMAVRIYDGDKTELFFGSGEDFQQALDDSENNQGKDFFIGHIEIVLLRRSDSTEILETLIKNNRLSPSCMVLYTDEPIESTERNDTIEVYEALQSRIRNNEIKSLTIADALKSEEK